MRRDYTNGNPSARGCSVVELVWLAHTINKEPVTVHSACHLPITLSVRNGRIILMDADLGAPASGFNIFLTNHSDDAGGMVNHALVRLAPKEKLVKHHFVVEDFPNTRAKLG